MFLLSRPIRPADEIYNAKDFWAWAALLRAWRVRDTMLLEVQPGLIVQERANESSSSSGRREQGNCFLDGRASPHSRFPFRAGAVSRANGTVKKNVEPRPGLLSTHIRPP
jgi:hypothetical protein